MRVLLSYCDYELAALIEQKVNQIIDEPCQVQCVGSKIAFYQYMENHPDCRHVVLAEMFNGIRYEAEEMTYLTYETERIVVPVLPEERKGSDFMRTLYAGGILTAVYAEKEKDTLSGHIAHALTNGRSRIMARMYYGIGGGLV